MFWAFATILIVILGKIFSTSGDIAYLPKSERAILEQNRRIKAVHYPMSIIALIILAVSMAKRMHDVFEGFGAVVGITILGTIVAYLIVILFSWISTEHRSNQEANN